MPYKKRGGKRRSKPAYAKDRKYMNARQKWEQKRKKKKGYKKVVYTVKKGKVYKKVRVS